MKIQERVLNRIGYVGVTFAILGTNPITTLLYPEYIKWLLIPVIPFMALSFLIIIRRLEVIK